MKKLLIATALAGALATPAFADNIALTMWTNPSDIVTETGLGSVDLGPQNLDGVTVTLTTGNRLVSPNGLNEANINIDNTNKVAETLNIIVGANDYLGHSDAFKLSGTIITTGGSAELAGSYFVDGSDTLNGQSTSVVGTDIRNFDSLPLTGPDSFSFNGFGFESVLGPYGLAERLTLTLQPGAAVGVQGLAMVSVPEPRTWTLLAAGFVVMGLASVRRARKDRLATIV
jgi:hypothetical protein